MTQTLAAVTIVVDDYDAAIEYYVDVLGFTLLEDTHLGSTKRFVRVGPTNGCALLLARAVTEAQRARIGDQTGGRVALFLHTDDIVRDYARYTTAGVDFVEGLRDEVYGRVVVFRDVYGNLWDLVQPK